MTTDATLGRLTEAVAALTDREAELAAELAGGMAFAQEEAGLRRLGAVWRAVGLVLLDEADRKRAVIAGLEGDVGADGGG